MISRLLKKWIKRVIILMTLGMAFPWISAVAIDTSCIYSSACIIAGNCCRIGHTIYNRSTQSGQTRWNCSCYYGSLGNYYVGQTADGWQSETKGQNWCLQAMHGKSVSCSSYFDPDA